MGRKAKEGSVNLYYLKKQDEKKDKSVSKIRTKKNNNSQKKKVNQNKKSIKKDKFNFHDEIVIGVTKSSNNIKKSDKKNQTKNKQNNLQKTKKVQVSKKNKKKERSLSKIKIFKFIFILFVLLAAMISFMLSPVFNIKEIEINGNAKVSSEQIISLSEIILGENIYKINKLNMINKIKQNPYIEEVVINRRFPSILEVNVKERQATYMLEYLNSYAYINNQGYILEISDKKLDKPILVGISTKAEDIKAGKRLYEEDLIRLENALKIIESATSNEIERLITKIDVSDELNYILYLDTEGKTVRLGNTSDINTKMLHIKAIIEKEAGIEGEIIVNSVSEDSKSRFIQKIN